MDFKCSSFTFLMIGMITVTFHGVKSYRTFQDETEFSNYCMYKGHFIPNPTQVCCNGTGLARSGISLDEHWDACVSEGEKAKNAQEASWAIYSCIIQAKNGNESSITLKKFGELMAENFPTEIQSSIIKECSSTGGEKETNAGNIDEMNKIRIKYFDVEKAICNGIRSGPKLKDLGKERACAVWEEDIHRGGKCCKDGKKSFPFDAGYKHFIDSDLSLKKDLCREQLANVVFPKYNLTNGTEDAIIAICDLSCELMTKGDFKVQDLLNKNPGGMNYKDIAMKLVPSWLPKKTKELAAAFATSKLSIKNTTEAMRYYEFTDWEERYVSEGERIEKRPKKKFRTTTTEGPDQVLLVYKVQRNFEYAVVHVPIQCQAHKELLAYLEMYIYDKGCE